MYSTTWLAVEDAIGELLGPIAVWLVVGITFLVGIQLLVVGAIIAGVPSIGAVPLAAGALAVLGSGIAAAWVAYAAAGDP